MFILHFNESINMIIKIGVKVDANTDVTPYLLIQFLLKELELFLIYAYTKNVRFLFFLDLIEI